MKKFLMLAVVMVMCAVVGCGGKRSAGVDYPDVGGVYALEGVLTTDCGCGGEQTWGTNDRVAFIQNWDDPSQVTMMSAWNGFVIGGVLAPDGGFKVVDGDPDPRVTISYDGSFEKDPAGEVVYHKGTLSAQYGDGRCCNGSNGSTTYQYWGGRDFSANAPGDGGKG